MKKEPSETTLTATLLPENEVNAVREQLERIISSPAFRSSRRYPDFLRYTVEHTLNGERENIKERVLGVEVFGRDPDYDTSSDPVVRMTAAEVRKRLEQYYRVHGHEYETRIEFPRGSYVPEFSFPADNPKIIQEAPAAKPAEDTHLRAPRRWQKYSMATAIVAVAVVAAWAATSTRQNAMERFWAPVFDSQAPVLLCIPDLSNLADEIAAHPNPNLPWASGIAQMPRPWVRDEVSFVDAFTVMKVASALTKKGRNFRLVHTEDATLDDLKQGPAVLIGGTNNTWINQVSSELRFALAQDGPLDYISDRQNPPSRQWGITWQNPGVDYAIISRVFDTTTGQPVVIAAGVHRSGTEAAGECLSDLSCFADAEKMAPGDWRQADLQFIVKTRVINGIPGQPQVVAAYLLH
jgi:hypothetical protein